MTIIYKRKGYKIDRVSIPQTPGCHKIEYFVDDDSGKNIQVFDDLHKAKDFISTLPYYMSQEFINDLLNSNLPLWRRRQLTAERESDKPLNNKK
jgi:hypothetical protein